MLPKDPKFLKFAGNSKVYVPEYLLDLKKQMLTWFLSDKAVPYNECRRLQMALWFRPDKIISYRTSAQQYY